MSKLFSVFSVFRGQNLYPHRLSVSLCALCGENSRPLSSDLCPLPARMGRGLLEDLLPLQREAERSDGEQRDPRPSNVCVQRSEV